MPFNHNFFDKKRLILPVVGYGFEFDFNFNREMQMHKIRWLSFANMNK